MSNRPVLNLVLVSALLGAPLRYVVLTEAGPDQRAAGQGLLSVVLSIGQLTGAALVGAIAASNGAGPAGYQQGFLAIGVIMAVMVVVGFALKNRAAEQKKADSFFAGDGDPKPAGEGAVQPGRGRKKLMGGEDRGQDRRKTDAGVDDILCGGNIPAPEVMPVLDKAVQILKVPPEQPAQWEQRQEKP